MTWFKSRDFALDVIKEDVDKHSAFEKYGRNSDVDTGSTPEDIWNGGSIYTGFPTGAAETLEIFSSDASDSLAGTGAQTVEISNLLDGSGNVMPAITVDMAGVTPVSLGAQTYSRSTRMRVITAGSNGANAGELTLRHTTTTANIFAVMPIGKNRTAILAYTVPTGKTLYLNRVCFTMARANGSAGSANVALRARPSGQVFEAVISPEITDAHSYTFENNGFRKFEAGTDLKGSAEGVSDNNTVVTGDWGGFLVDD